MRRLRSLWRSLVRRGQVEQDMAEELAFHIDARAADLRARHGLPAAEAFRRARIEFGSIEKYKEEGRASLGLRLADELRHDVRFARRTFTGNKGFFAAAVAILALGIGGNTAVFSVVDAMLLYELPVPDPGSLVAFDSLRDRNSMVASYSGSGRPGPAGTVSGTSFPTLTLEEFREHTTTLSHVFAFAPVGAVAVAADDHVEMATAQLVSGAYHDGLSVSALLGRTLDPSDDRPGADPVAVVSHRYWQRRFAGTAGAVGRTIAVNRVPFTIVGVTQAGFHGTEVSETVDVTVPLAMATRLSGSADPRPASSWWLLLMGRLKPGSTHEQVRAELEPIFRQTVLASWAARPPQTRDPWRSGMPTLRVRPGAQGPDGPSRSARQNLGLLFAVTGVVLLIACVNVASLLLVRAASRRQEIAVRRALGASRGRLVRQLLSECLLVAGAGAAAGVAVAAWAKDALPALFEADAVLETALDVRAIGFACGLMIVTALAFGVGYALRATRVDVAACLKAGPRAGGAQRALAVRALIGLQIAASLMLLVVAGLLVRTLQNYRQVDVGFDTADMMVFQVDPGPSLSATTVYALYERLVDAIDAVPGVRSVTMSAMPVLARSRWIDAVRTEAAGETRSVHIQAVRWNFFETMGIPLLTGRSLESSDTDLGPRVAVINAAMARLLFDQADPVGRHFHFANGPDQGVPIQVVGVVRDARYSTLQDPPPPTFFMPYVQIPPRRMTFEIRTAGEPLAFAGAVRAAVRTVDASLPLIRLRTQEQQIAETIQGPRTFAWLTGVSGFIGLLLACAGLFGVVAYDARRRTKELGLRIALGASRFDVVRLVMQQTLGIVTIGVIAGLVLAVIASRVVASQLFGVTPLDPPALGSAVVVLVLVGSLAGYLPARRAARLDPTQALRYE